MCIYCMYLVLGPVSIQTQSLALRALRLDGNRALGMLVTDCDTTVIIAFLDFLNTVIKCTFSDFRGNWICTIWLWSYMQVNLEH